MTEERVQRRLAAILSSDVVGYSKMMGRDEAGTLARIKSLRADFLHPKVSEYGGRIVKTTGDGTLIEFGSAVDAVAHAVDVQRGLVERNAKLPEDQKIRFRLGINVGDIIIDGNDIFGDGVNVAARLESLAEPGGICISARVHDYVGDRLDLAFEDLGRQSMKNISEPIHVYKIRLVESSPSSGAGSRSTPPLPDKPSIAVLPFQNMSGDPEQEFLADGIAEDITTALSRLRWLFVIARNSTFAYKGQSPDVRAVARDLGVRYVLEGSIRRAGTRVRVTAQLIDAGSGSHVWAERYDRDIEDIFELQDEITAAIVRAVDPEIQSAEQERALRKPPSNLTAWDHYQRALRHQYRGARDDLDRACEELSAAIAADPGFAAARAAKSFTTYLYVNYGLTDSPDEALAEAEKLAEDAVALDDKDPFAHFALSRVFSMRGEFARAISQIQRALELNPNFAFAYYALAMTLFLSGRVEESLTVFDDAIRQSPQDPYLYAYQQMKGVALAHLGRQEEALEWCAKAVRHQNADVNPHLIYASVLGNSDRIEEARRQIAAAGAKAPGLTAARIMNGPFRSMFKEGRARLLDGLHKAGLPE